MNGWNTKNSVGWSHGRLLIHQDRITIEKTFKNKDGFVKGAPAIDIYVTAALTKTHLQ